jgi:S1-C subfamily serine protease
LPVPAQQRYSRGVLVSKRIIVSSAAMLAVCGLAVSVNFVITLRQEIQRNQQEVSQLRELAQSQRDEIHNLHDSLGSVGRELLDVRSIEAVERRKLLARLESKAGTQTAVRRREFDELERRIAALKTAANEHERLLAAARVSQDLELRYRELMSPTVRVNARHEVGSGSILWSKGVGKKKSRTYILTAWHIVQENVDDDGELVPLDIDFYNGGSLVRSEPGRVVARQEGLDLALIEVRGYSVYEQKARLPRREDLDRIGIFSKVYAIGCPLGYSPLPTSGELTSKTKELDGNMYWMINAPTIFGNSGGGIYHAESRTLIGVLSRISAYKNMIDVAVPHMGLVTPMNQVYDWLDKTRFGFVYRDRFSPRASKALRASTKKKQKK